MQLVHRTGSVHSLDVDQRSEPDSGEAKRAVKRVIRWIVIDFVGRLFVMAWYECATFTLVCEGLVRVYHLYLGL